MSFPNDSAMSSSVAHIVRFNEAGHRVPSLHFMHIVHLSSDNEKHSQEVSVWADFSPTLAGCIVYLFVVPFFCMVGIVTNSVNIFIFSRPRIRAMACSAYFYFKGLKWSVKKRLMLHSFVYFLITVLQQYPFSIWCRVFCCFSRVSLGPYFIHNCLG